MDLTFHDEALRMIVDASSTPKIIIEKSTVPCGTAERVSKLVGCYTFNMACIVLLKITLYRWLKSRALAHY